MAALERSLGDVIFACHILTIRSAFRYGNGSTANGRPIAQTRMLAKIATANVPAMPAVTPRFLIKLRTASRSSVRGTTAIDLSQTDLAVGRHQPSATSVAKPKPTETPQYRTTSVDIRDLKHRSAWARDLSG